jgi:RNA polymerase sigma factor (TIGR02999 family)
MGEGGFGTAETWACGSETPRSPGVDGRPPSPTLLVGGLREGAMTERAWLERAEVIALLSVLHALGPSDCARLPRRPMRAKTVVRCPLLPATFWAVILDRMSEVTPILSAIERGDPHAAERLLPLVYDELRKLAAQRLAREKAGQTLQATALVHEAYLRLVDAREAQHWNSRGHFFAAAAEAMRRILVERARHKRSLKAGGDRRRQELADVEPSVDGPDLDLLALNEALEKLESKDRRKAELVKLRFFAGFTTEEAAGLLGISTSTADNDWAYARCWLRVEMAGRGDDEPS